VVYLSRYFTPDEDVATADVDSMAEEWLKICAQLFPHFDPGQVGAVHAFRTPYGAPLVSYPYLPQIPPVEAHLPGLYLATTAQIYPQDRGMSEGIKRGIQVAEQMLGIGWTCPVCGGRHHVDQFTVSNDATEGGVDAESFVPSSAVYGKTAGRVVRCFTCAHGSLEATPTDEAISGAYADAADEVSLREEDGQVETGVRALRRVERRTTPGRMLDVGCWTGSFLEAGRRRGWDPEGIEPSRWAAARARERGLLVHEGELDDADLPAGAFRLVTACDVLEHLVDPGAALDRIAELLEDGGVFYGTVPDAGSRLARAMGRRWWSVMPMHVQYFTRGSMTRLLERHGFDVLDIDRHAKVCSARSYAERLESFVPTGGLPTKLVEKHGKADSQIAPDIRERLLVVARKR
jgi:predicted TPR repeat methyltransferase